MTDKRPLSPYLPLLLAVACTSVGSIFVRLAQAPSLAVAFYRIFLASLIISPFALKAAVRSWPTLTGRERLLLAGSGVALALHFATWIASLSLTTIAASVILVNTAPLFTVAFSRLFLRESSSPTVLFATALAIIGTVFIAVGDWRTGAMSLLGDALAMIGAVTLSVYCVIGRGLRDALPLNAYILGVWGTATVALALLMLLAGVPVLGYLPRTFGFFFALALIPTIGGHGLVNLALRALPAPIVAMFLLGEPIGASCFAFVLFGEVPSPFTLLGGAIVLLALVLIIRYDSR